MSSRGLSGVNVLCDICALIFTCFTAVESSFVVPGGCDHHKYNCHTVKLKLKVMFRISYISYLCIYRDLKLALDFRRAWESGNFVRASRLSREMSPLLQLAVYRQLSGLRQ